MIVYETYSPEDTKAFARKLGKILKGGEILCLDGDLGAGKTAFTQGLAEGMGIKEFVTSPTFTLMNIYEAAIPLYHLDVYRIHDPEEMFEIGFEEVLYGEGVTVIEWSNQIKELLPETAIRIEIKKDLERGVDLRIIKIIFPIEKYAHYQELFQG